MREMKDSGVPWIGNIPVDWDVSIVLSEFEEVKNINKGMLEKNLLSLSYGNIVRKEINSNNGLLPDSFETYNVIPQNSIVLRLTDLQNDKRSLRSAICNEQGIITSAYTTIQLKSDIENHPRYMNYLFRCYDDCKVFYGLGNGVRQSINYSELKRVAILKPRYNCQMQIAKYLDTKCTQIDTIIAKEQSVIEKLQEYRQSIITEMVVRGVNTNELFKPINCEWIDMIPNGWSLIKLGMIANVKSNLVSPLDYPNLLQISPENIEKDTGKVLNIKTVRESGIISDNHLFNKGQIIYSKVRPTLNKVIIADFDGLCSADMYPIETIVNVKYLVYFMRSKLFVSQVDRISSDRVKMPKINKMELKQLFCFIPSEEDQKRIVELLDSKCERIDMVILGKQVLIDKLTEYKKSLIYEVVTGKKEVPHV